MPVIISDLDGTILDVRERFAHAQVATFSSLGFDVPYKKAYNLYRWGYEPEILLGKLGITLSQEQWSLFFKRIDEEFYHHWNYSYVIPGVIEALHIVKPRVEGLQLITSRARIAETRSEFSAFGLDQVFDRVYTRGDLAKAEGVNEIPLFPFLNHRRRLIQLALSDIDHHEDVWILGDSTKEIEAAKSLGHVAVGVLTGFAKREDLEPTADYILSSVAEITSLL